MVTLETTIIALALPEIREAFPDTDDATLSWIITAYNIGVASFLLLSGWWADKAGRKKVFLIGLFLFAVGSGFAGLAPSARLLILARVVQSVGGAIQYPAGLALLLPAFPPERRQSAIGIWGAMGALAAAVGPSLGSILVEAFGWRSIFTINVPVALLALVLGRVWLDESYGEVAGDKVDKVSVPLASLGIGAIILGIVQGGTWGALSLIPIAIGGALLTGFVVRSRRHEAPLFDLGLFSLRSFTVSSVGTVAFSLAFFSWLVTMPTFIQDVWGWSVLRTGFAIAPGPMVAMVVSPLFGRLADRKGIALPVIIGALAGASGLLLQVSLLGIEPAYVKSVLLPGLLIGVAAGASFSMLVAAAMRDVPAAQFGMAGAGRSTIFQLSVAVGVAMGFVLTADSGSNSEALSGIRTLFIVGAILYFIQFLVFAFAFPRHGPETVSA